MTTIYQYFTDKLGAAPADDTLPQLPINSNPSGHPSQSADGPLLMLWTAPPPAHRCHGCGRC
jgi:hypothetical protein